MFAKRLLRLRYFNKKNNSNKKMKISIHYVFFLPVGTT